MLQKIYDFKINYYTEGPELGNDGTDLECLKPFKQTSTLYLPPWKR